ncbi:alpha/beta hydrolase [Amycolatopsis sp. OK19-0408]|uniref:Alpha/beta hydrolase n=1 Tax=Amycolatopsis iheyensis TaxID=2945988 RepID=A0A9X2N8K9_9PSEU|nr:alpha/beta hydrolase [Amycolatopsis iheyensis]MCR6482360.1 alpha/beta hydrolase [Amycolatopsis iheyensis]
MSTHTVRHEGAELRYELRGEGPLLVLIAGRGGDGARYTRLAERLAGSHAVLTYDRQRRATGFDMGQQARDTAAIIHAARPRAPRAAVFGQGGGGSVAFELAAHLPDLVTELVVHEAPTITLLPDAPKWLSHAREVHATHARRGTAAALALTDIDPADFADQAEADAFLAREFLAMALYTPDLDAVRRSGIPVVTAAGEKSRDTCHDQAARVQAEHLACRYTRFPGGHHGFESDVDAFAPALATTLAELRRP